MDRDGCGYGIKRKNKNVFTAEAQSTQRFFIGYAPAAHNPEIVFLSVLCASAVKIFLLSI